MGVALSNYGTHGVRQGGAIDHLRAVLPPADLTVATDAETAWPVRLLGQGRLAYFAQHSGAIAMTLRERLQEGK